MATYPDSADTALTAAGPEDTPSTSGSRKKAKHTSTTRTFFGETVEGCDDLGMELAIKAQRDIELSVQEYLQRDASFDMQKARHVGVQVGKVGAEVVGWGVVTKLHPADEAAGPYMHKVLGKADTAMEGVQGIVLTKEDKGEVLSLMMFHATRAIRNYHVENDPASAELRKAVKALDEGSVIDKKPGFWQGEEEA